MRSAVILLAVVTTVASQTCTAAGNNGREQTLGRMPAATVIRSVSERSVSGDDDDVPDGTRYLLHDDGDQ